MSDRTDAREPDVWMVTLKNGERMVVGSERLAKLHGGFGSTVTPLFRATRTPEPAGDSETADLRELRERLRARVARWKSVDKQHIVLHYDEAAEVVAALERLEALERYSRNLLAVSRAVGVLGATEVSEAEEALDRLLATPAPASQKGGEG